MFGLIPGMGLARTALSGAALCAVFFVMMNWVKTNCTCFRRADIRRIWGVGRLFLKLGIDPYPEFSVLLTIHSAKDVNSSSKLYSVAYAKYESFKTRALSSGKWEQSTRLIVPQGSEEISVYVYASKLLGSDEMIGSCSISIARCLMGNLASDFYGKKKQYKINQPDGGTAGQISLTFKKANDSQQEELPLVAGLDADQRPALYGELMEVLEEGGPRNLKGAEKLRALSKVMQGKLQKIGKGLSGNTMNFFAVLEMSNPDNSDSEETVDKKKWFWAWWEDKKDFLKSSNEPDGYVPILAITSIHSDSSKPGEFVIKYVQKPGNKKSEIRYKCTDKDVEVWTDALELFREEARELKTAQKERAEEWDKLSAAQRMDEWTAHYRAQGYSEEELKKYYQQYQLAQMPPEQRTKYLQAAAKKQRTSVV